MDCLNITVHMYIRWWSVNITDICISSIKHGANTTITPANWPAQIVLFTTKALVRNAAAAWLTMTVLSADSWFRAIYYHAVQAKVIQDTMVQAIVIAQ